MHAGSQWALAGHKRYAHVTALRADRVLPELLGMDKIVSEDSLRRALRSRRITDESRSVV